MRQVYVFVLLFYLILHFVIPMVYYHFFGFVNLFSHLDYNSSSVIMGISMNFISILGTIVVISFLPNKKIPVSPIFNHSFKFLLIAICLFSYSITGTSYEDILDGAKNGTWISYVLLFFDVTVSLLLFLFLQKNIKFSSFAILAYVILQTYAGSRSSIIVVVIAYLSMRMFTNGFRTMRKMRRIVLFFSILSPFMFSYATSVRTSIDQSLVSKLIVGRVSMVELSSIPIDAVRDNSMNRILYNEKYGVLNQLKLAINEVSPINFFENDVNPNQYHRSIFLDLNELSVIDNYMSMNMTLPTYFYLSSNFFLGCLLTIFFLSSIYVVWIRLNSNIYIMIIILTQLYYLLQYFDWVMLVAGSFRVVLTIFMLKCFEKAINILMQSKTLMIEKNIQ